MAQRKWHIRIEPIDEAGDPTSFRISIDYGRGFSERVHVFNVRLPPSFTDLVDVAADVSGAGPADATRTRARQRVWRRPPGEMPPEMHAYNAGDLATLGEIGARLYEALFVNTAAHNDFTDILDDHRQGSGVRIALDIPPASKLSRVPWEAILPRGREEFMATMTNSNIVRLARAEVEGAPPLPADLPLRLYVAVANPDNDLATGTEVADIAARLKALENLGDARIRLVKTREGTTRSQFRKDIFDHKPHIVHFIGHGDFIGGKGFIYFHDEVDPRAADPIDSGDLRTFLQNDRPWLVVLNSCLGARASVVDPFGGAAHNLIRINIPFVVAMQLPVTDLAAIAFSDALYHALGSNARVPDAVSQARQSIQTCSSDEGIKAELFKPVLYVPAHSELDTIETVPIAPPVAPPPVVEPDVVARHQGGWRRKALAALAVLLGLPALAAVAWWMLGAWGGRSLDRHAPPMAMVEPSTAPLSGGSAVNGATADFAEAVGSDGAPPSTSGEPLPGRGPLDVRPVQGSESGMATGIGYGSAGPGISAPPPRPRPPAGTMPPPPPPPSEGQGQGQGGGGYAAGNAADLASEASDIAVSGWAGRRSLRVFVGGALSPRDGDLGLAGGVTLGARTGAWSHRVQAGADLTPREGRDRARIAADYAVERRIGDSPFRIAGELAYLRNDRIGLRRRFAESVGVRWAGGGVALTAAAAAVQTRFTPGEADARRASIGGLARVEAFTDVGEAVTLEGRAQILAADPVSATAGAKISYRLSDRAALVVSADVDHERDAPTRPHTSVSARAGLAVAF